MGYVLLWIENLAFWLLLAALLVALACRRRGWRRRLLLAAAVLLPVAVWGGISGSLGVVELRFPQAQTGILGPAVALLVCTLVGSVAVAFYGLRRGGQEPRACGWRVASLGLATLAVLLVHFMTFWNLDLAVRQQMESMRVEAGALALSVSPPRVFDRENAALLYQRAFDAGLLDKKPEGYRKWLGWTNDQREAFDAEDPALAAYMRRMAPVLKIVRQAAARPACNFSRDWGRPDYEMLLPETQNMREAARLLQLEIHFAAAQGDLRRALQDVVAMRRMAEHVGQEPLLVSLLVSFALDAMADGNLEFLLQTYSIPGEDLAVLDESQRMPPDPRVARALEMETAFGISKFCQLAGSGDLADGSQVQAVGGPNVGAFYRVFLLPREIESYRWCMRQWQQAMLLPHHQRQEVIDDLSESVLQEAQGGVFTRLLLPALEQTHVAAMRTEARQRLAQLGVAVYRFRQEHGRFPQSLAELVDEEVVLVPRDPFDGQPLRMVQHQGEVVLYSIGPDLQGGQQGAVAPSAPSDDITFTLR